TASFRPGRGRHALRLSRLRTLLSGRANDSPNHCREILRHLSGCCGDRLSSMIIERTMTTMGAEQQNEQSDTQLVARCLAGDRDAFSGIVARYQTLICSLAYSRVGNLSQSEDIAQDTFVTAWKHLRLLREPAKLRSWLCGIVRNRIHKSLRQSGREPA